MIFDGRAFGAILSLKHVLGLLQQKGLISQDEIILALNDASTELASISNRTHTGDAPHLSLDAVHQAAKTIEYLRPHAHSRQ
jgi:hypothetical protein